MEDYSRKIMFPNFFAPAVIQRFASQMLFSKIGGGALLFRKTRAFRSFQIVHDASMVREAMAFLLGTPAPVLFVHHSLTELSTCHVEVSI